MKEEVHHQVIWNVAEIIKGTAILLGLITLVYFVETYFRDKWQG